MFKNLGQLKTYLQNVDNFDQLYIIQQGGRGVTQEQIIRQLKNAIKNDLKQVFEANNNLFKNIKINNQNVIKNFDDFRDFITSPHFDEFMKNYILITK